MAHIALDRAAMVADGQIEALPPGMAVTAEIKTGRATGDFVSAVAAAAVCARGGEGEMNAAPRYKASPPPAFCRAMRVFMVILALLVTVLGWGSYYVSYYTSLIVLSAFLMVFITSSCATRDLLHKKPSSAMLGLIPLLFILSLYSGYGAGAFLERTGLRIKLFLTGQFSANYEQSIFCRDGVKEAVRHYAGMEKIIPPIVVVYILFDSTGEIMKSPADRSQAWKRAVEALPLGHMIARSALPTKRILGCYYEIHYTEGDSEA